jgi:ubiquinone/menaquinone biosynthesis C-methylase UbiE
MGEHRAGSDRLFAGSIPAIYDRLLVPLIFETYAQDLAERIAATAPRDILETATGTGALTRALATRLPPDTRITATGLNAPMLDYAMSRQNGDPRIEWREADALALPFESRSFDAVACQFGVMFFPDKSQGFREAYRVLRPGGRFLFNVWDRIEENEFAAMVTQALANVFPHDPPLFLARTPYGYFDERTIRGGLGEAGFADITVEPMEAMSRASSARDVAVAYCQGTPLRNEIEARDASRLEAATDAAAEALERKFGSGPLEGRIRALVLGATR